MIELSKLRLEPARQARVELNQETVSEYADAMRAGSKFPPVICYFDGMEFWLADGYHRVMAAQAAGLTEIYEDRHPGTRRDAVLHSLSANAKHGLRRSNRDKRRAVETMLADPEWATWSSNEIAKRCSVGVDMVIGLRASHLSETKDNQPQTVTVQRNGTTYTVDVSRIGKQPKTPAEEPMEPSPEPPGDEPAESEPKPTKPDADGVSLPAPRPKTKLLSEEESARILSENANLQAENTELRERIDEIAADAQESLDDNTRMSAIFEADDNLAEAMKEIARQAAEIRILQERLVGETNGKNEYIRLVKYWRRKAEKLEKAAKEGGA